MTNLNDLDDVKKIEQIDRARMRAVLNDLPRHCQAAWLLGEDISLSTDYRNVKNIVFSGMGGSGIGAEIVSYYLRSELKLVTYLNRDYSLPEFVDKQSLVILISYSGNTEETLNAYTQARRCRARIFVLSSGGRLVDLARADGYPLLLLPGQFPPRGALAFLSLPVLSLFVQMNLIADKQAEVAETVDILKKLKTDALALQVPIEKNPAKKMARRLFDNFCVVYASAEHLTGVVTRWRGQFAENSKTLSSSHVLPEMNHNEIVGWQNPQKLLKKFVAVILRDRSEHPQVKKRIEISKEILIEAGMQLEEIWSQGEGLLARIFSLIYLGDFVSFYLAILNGVDPTPVKRIDYLKRRLKET